MRWDACSEASTIVQLFVGIVSSIIASAIMSNSGVPVGNYVWLHVLEL
jgi:hypothetical protein